MHRLFSMFPTGVPGVGLLVLRAAVTLALWPGPHGVVLLAGATATFWILVCLSALLSVGAATPIASACCVAGQCLAMADPTTSTAHAVALALAAFALVLLGPGAYSVDARLYGHRAVRIRIQR